MVVPRRIRRQSQSHRKTRLLLVRTHTIPVLDDGALYTRAHSGDVHVNLAMSWCVGGTLHTVIAQIIATLAGGVTCGVYCLGDHLMCDILCMLPPARSGGRKITCILGSESPKCVTPQCHRRSVTCEIWAVLPCHSAGVTRDMAIISVITVSSPIECWRLP